MIITTATRRKFDPMKATDAAALRRSLSAVRKLMVDINNGTMPSHELEHLIGHALRAEFGGATERGEYARQISAYHQANKD